MPDLWSVEQADAIEWLNRQPDDSIDLLVTSPPYERARTYGISKALPAGQDWVDWMVRVVTAAAPKVKGLIAVNCEGQTRGYKYSAVPFLLMADLHRAGFNLRKPLVFERDGIPGSGGPDWFKNRWEPIICITRPGKLPWSDNTACGNPPKFEPGGEIANRLADGKRLNDGESQRAIARKIGYPMRQGTSGVSDDGVNVVPTYVPPDIANPGNVIKFGADTHYGFGNKNEAPYPVELPAFLVKSCCPPGGVVADPFVGSGTTCQAAVENGRRFRGCDVRQSQVELTRRRMATVTLPLFA